MKDKQDVQDSPHEIVAHTETCRFKKLAACGDWPEPNPVFKETVVRQIMDHRAGTGPISNAEPTDVFELETVLRT